MIYKWCIFFLLLIVACPCSIYAQNSGSAIRINQLGYYPAANKIAVFQYSDPNQLQSGKFYLIKEPDGDTVFSGMIGAPSRSAYSDAITQRLDFSDFRSPGKYYLHISGGVNSYSFRIDKAVHASLLLAAVKGFYYQRSNIPIENEYGGAWARPAGHADTAVFIHASAASSSRPAGTIVSSPGGWYDAGDYNKYIVNSGITMGTLMSLFEDHPDHFRNQELEIPENKDNIPDLLNEILYNLRWMLTMQDPEDGGVYHKCTNAAFDGMVMPGVTMAPRYLVQKSTAAALNFSAVMAQASRIFRNYSNTLPALADSCLQAAYAAWEWAELYPDILYRQSDINGKYTPAISTGEYGDRILSDEWFWASAELLVATKDKKFARIIEQHRPDILIIPSWNNVAVLGYYSMLRQGERDHVLDNELSKSLERQFLAAADSLILNGGNKAFATIMGQSKSDFVWGSSSVAANQSIFLLNAWRLKKKKDYLDGALSNLDYIMGRNATGYCFVTGIGTLYPKHPHHRPSVADGIDEPVPGLLSGGPNPGQQDKCNYTFHDPENSFTDIDCSYASNEIAINWQAPLVYLAGAVEAIYSPRIK